MYVASHQRQSVSPTQPSPPALQDGAGGGQQELLHALGAALGAGCITTQQASILLQLGGSQALHLLLVLVEAASPASQQQQQQQLVGAMPQPLSPVSAWPPAPPMTQAGPLLGAGGQQMPHQFLQHPQEQQQQQPDVSLAGQGPSDPAFLLASRLEQLALGPLVQSAPVQAQPAAAGLAEWLPPQPALVQPASAPMN